MLRVEHVRKQFGATVAVDDVSLSIDRARIAGLVGENGAGKTTLMRIVAGELTADGGHVSVAGPVGIVHQHFALVPQFTVAENLALSRREGFQFTTRRRLHAEASRTVDESGIVLPDVTRRVADLSVGEKSKLELIKAIAIRPSLLILDEPTSVLTPIESEELFDVMRRLASAGTAIVFISHKVREVLEVASRVVVLRGGRLVADGERMSAEEIAAAMVGGRAPSSRPLQRPSAATESAPALQVADLRVHQGQVVAIVGVAGNGQSELLQAIHAGRTAKMAFIPEDRARDGLVPQMTIAENIALGTPRWQPREAYEKAARCIALYGIRARGPHQLAGQLSGGNQQKVVLARELDRQPEVIVAAEPTRGLDIEATRVVHEQLRAAVAAGAALLLVTSDLDEAFALADEVHVMFRGRLSVGMTPAVAQHRVAALMAGLE